MYINDGPIVQLKIYYRSLMIPQYFSRTVFHWFCANTLSLNETKTQYMVIQSASIKLNNSLELKIGGVVVSDATHCKFLGITIDESLMETASIKHKKQNITGPVCN